jgi:hypothetical protein
MRKAKSALFKQGYWMVMLRVPDIPGLNKCRDPYYSGTTK